MGSMDPDLVARLDQSHAQALEHLLHLAELYRQECERDPGPDNLPALLAVVHEWLCGQPDVAMIMLCTAIDRIAHPPVDIPTGLE